MTNRLGAAQTLRRIFMGAQWVQVCLSIPLCFHLARPAISLVGMTVVLVVFLLTKYGQQAKSARIIARLLVGIVWLLAAAFAVDAGITLAYNQPSEVVWVSMVAIAGPSLPYLSLAAGANAVQGVIYDRVVACFSSTWLLVISLLHNLTDVQNFIQPNAYIDNPTPLWWAWTALLAITAVSCYICAFMRVSTDTATNEP